MSDLFTNSEAATTEKAPQELVSLMQGSGLAESKQNEIAAALGAFFAYAQTWTETVESLVITDPSETGKMQMAKAGRLDLKNKRLEASKLVDAKRDQVKAAMADFTLEDKLWLKAGQIMELQFKHLETKLEEKEKFAERFEAARLAKLKVDRLAILAPLGHFDGTGLDTIADAMFDALVSDLKAQIEAKAEAERQAEADRIAKEKADREERARIEAENARLKAEAEAKEKELAAERQRVKALEDAAKAKEAAEIAEKARIEAQRQADEKAAKIAADKAAKAPKKDKLTAWIDAAKLDLPNEFKDDAVVAVIVQKFDAFKAWAKTQIDGL